ncbi:MAG TPA: hypothetical protein VMA37_02495 [Acetobacteraceae bacterium]|nr:hypothetical protein [Acetobacteraceae bacterium]
MLIQTWRRLRLPLLLIAMAALGGCYYGPGPYYHHGWGAGYWHAPGPYYHNG